MIRLVSALLILLTASACEIVPPPGPPEWQAAFHDGCNSAGAAAVVPGRQYVKDQQAYLDPGSMYRMGWDDGWTTCMRQIAAVRPGLGVGVGVAIPVR